MERVRVRHIAVVGSVLLALAGGLGACSSSSPDPAAPANTDAGTHKKDSGTPGTVSSSDAGGNNADDAGSLPPPVQDAAGLPLPAWDGGTVSVWPAPAQGVFMGAFVGVGMESESDSDSEGLFTGEEALIDRRWVIDNRFYDDSVDWVNDRTKWDIANHLVPMITWMPYGNGDPLDEIIAGTHDAAITAQAQSAKALGAQILMRWGHEMNGNWYPWAGANNGGADAGATGAADKYVAAWKHVHDLFGQAGATNVVWVWCINVADVPEESWNHWSNYYPGDAYVDWVGLDAYNWGTSSSCCVWQSFSELVDSSYNDYAGKKPIMLPETASAEVGGDKAAWINDMHQQIKTNYKAIHGVVWFDINKETDWRIASSPATLASYKAMALDPYFSP
ncbi:MAG TPA: glycosyl hydrolase [Polyangiaceae bacterium]|jgi:endoglucanase